MEKLQTYILIMLYLQTLEKDTSKPYQNVK